MATADSLQAFLQHIDEFQRHATEVFATAADGDALEAARIRFLGDRSGELKTIQRELGAVAKEDKPAAGRAFNEAKNRVTALHEERARVIAAAKASGNGGAPQDLTMPARRVWTGAKHPVTLVIEEIAAIFRE